MVARIRGVSLTPAGRTRPLMPSRSCPGFVSSSEERCDEAEQSGFPVPARKGYGQSARRLRDDDPYVKR